MKSIKRTFEEIEKKNPNASSYICFAKTVKGQNFNDRIILSWFNKLVDKDDYCMLEKGIIVAYLRRLTKQPKD